MAFFRHKRNPAIYDVFLGFDAAQTTPQVKNTSLTLAIFDAWTASVMHFYRKQDYRGVPRQKKYSDAFGQVFCSIIAKLVSAVRQLGEHFHSKELEFDIYSISLKPRKKFVTYMLHSATDIVSLPSLSKAYLVTDAHWLHTSVSTTPVRVRVYYIADLADDLKSVIGLR